MKNKKYILFILIVWVILILPLAGMTFWPTNETTENKELAPFPKFDKENPIGQKYLYELGTYFEDHFAFRQLLVTANALLQSKLLQSNATNQVIPGRNDWLYFHGTLEDYQGRNLFSERERFAILHNLHLIQDYVEAQGSQFFLMIPPNKASLYGENMPYYIRKGTDSNLKRLTEMFQEEGISDIGLYDRFSKESEILYFKRDSHWTTKGALLAYKMLMEQTGLPFETYEDIPYAMEEIHEGDLDKMLYPLAVEKEADAVYEKEADFVYCNDVKNNMDEWIETENPKKDNSILMYRDSFGESLLPFVANAFGKGYFTRLVPYNLLQVEQYSPDVVVIEKVERNLDDFITDIPIVEPPQRENILGAKRGKGGTIETEKAGSFLKISGKLDEREIQTDTKIYVALTDEGTKTTKTYETFYTASENKDAGGYQLYLRGSSLPTGKIHCDVLAADEENTRIIAQKDIMWENEGGYK